MEEKKKRKAIDWEAIEREYRVGVRTLRDIAAEYGCAESAIRKKAKTHDWVRDLSAKINARAESLVRKAEVRNEVRKESANSESAQIQSTAQMLADKILGQRTDIQTARSTVQRLWDLVGHELDAPDDFTALGELLRQEDEFGQDKLNDIYRAAIGLPQQIKNAKLLADAIKTLIELERKVLRIDDDKKPDDSNSNVINLNDAQRASRIAFLLAKAGVAA